MAARVTSQLVQNVNQREDATVRVTSQKVQVSRDADINPIFKVTAQLLQVAKGFFPVTIEVKSTAYPKLHPTSFFSRAGSKSFVKGPNFARVTSQVTQCAYLRVPN